MGLKELAFEIELEMLMTEDIDEYRELGENLIKLEAVIRHTDHMIAVIESDLYQELERFDKNTKKYVL